MRKIKTLLLSMAIFVNLVACSQDNSKFKSVNSEAFATELKNDPNAYLLDVRTPQEYSEGHIQGATNLDWLDTSIFENGAQQLPKEATIYVYCRSGGRSAKAAEYLIDHGYKVVNLSGGYMGWKNSGK